MTNPYYTPTGAPAAATKGLSASVRSEFQLIEAAFAMLPTNGGTAVSIPYTFSTATTVADPGVGTLRLDNATQNAATAIMADLTDANSNDVTAIIGLFDDSTSTIKGYIKLTKVGDSTKWLLFSVSAMASPAGYRNITVANVASSAASPFSDGNSILLEFVRNGDKGDTGAPAPDATQAQMEAATSNVVVATPGNVNWHPGVAKAWIKCDAAGTIKASHNITSITDGGTGILTITLGTDFSSGDFVSVLSLEKDGVYMAHFTSLAAGVVQARCYDGGGTLSDPVHWNVVFFGDQA